jgi:tRNA (mo5U34)-methyltransferase
MDLRASLEACPEWYHSIELAPGVITPGRVSSEALAGRWRALCLPDLRGKSVLDIGAYDGFYSFSAEAAGAARVVALDHYVWAADMAAYMAQWRQTREHGQSMPAPHESCHWHPETLPGKRPFDLAHAARGSRVRAIVGDFMMMDLAPLGQFDVVFFLGVLYHLTDPLGALRRVARVTAPGGLAVVETEAMEAVGMEDRATWEFFPGEELNHDASNWWAPNATGLEGVCRAAGFRDVANVTVPPRPGRRARLRTALRVFQGQPTAPLRYRLVAHARPAPAPNVRPL